MIDYSKFKHDPLCEQMTDIICSKIGTDVRSFFRVHIAYYMTQIASSMRAGILDPGQLSSAQPINLYCVNLAPSGFGKGHSTHIMEEQVINQFRDAFLSKTWPTMVAHNLAQVADFRARKNQKDPQIVRVRLDKEFERCGNYHYSFSKTTEAAVHQMRDLLLLSKIGSINLQIDEIGSNLFKSKDALPAFLELYDGKLKTNMTKNTVDSVRSEAEYGVTPTNVMLFGVPGALLDNGKNEIEFTEMLENGYARRCHFGYLSDEDYARELRLITPAERLRLSKITDSDTSLDAIAEQLAELADPMKANMKLAMPDDTALMLFQYQNDCKERAFDMPAADTVAKTEMEHRHSKAKKLAGTYAFINGAPQVETQHMEAAIALTEESGDAFTRILHRDLAHVKLAKHLGDSPQELTKVSLREQLPYFKGSKQDRDEMLNEAIDWGYTNNIAIRRRFSNGVEFYSGTRLESNDLSQLRISYSTEFTDNYTSTSIPWSLVSQFASTDDVHWINHHLENGFDNVGYRDGENCIPGFNMVVIDVDGETTIQAAKQVLADYKAFYYLTKRHTHEEHRFRILLPINYTLELSEDDFAGFMDNLYAWLPFTADDHTGQRSRKWLSNKGHHMYTDGKLLDALPFIPRTNMQAKYAERLVDLKNMGGLERWFLLNTSNGKGNRNNNLLRYAMLLVDGGLDAIGIRDQVLALNNKLPVPIPESRVDSTIMKTVSKKLQNP